MLKQDFIHFIYQQNIIQLGTVKLKSGEYTDHFYNFGKIDTPDTLAQLSKWLIYLVGDLEFDAIFTSAYKGIHIQTGFALEYGYQYPFRKIKFGYMRKKEKPYGEDDEIVGYRPKKGDKVLLLDDVFTTGTSLAEMYKFSRHCGALPILAVVPILRADKNLFSKFNQQIQIPIRYIIHDDDVVKVYQQYKGK